MTKFRKPLSEEIVNLLVERKLITNPDKARKEILSLFHKMAVILIFAEDLPENLDENESRIVLKWVENNFEFHKCADQFIVETCLKLADAGSIRGGEFESGDWSGECNKYQTTKE